MPTVKIDINTGIEYSPTDGVDSGVKLHNFTVGTDGSLYKLPALKNLKSTITKNIGTSGGKTVHIPYQIHDLKKFQTAATYETAEQTISNKAERMEMFRRFAFLTAGSYGTLNIDYKGNTVIPGDAEYFPFEHDVYEDKPELGNRYRYDISSLSPKIAIDFNAQYNNSNPPERTENIRAVFPMHHMWQTAQSENPPYNLLISPRNMVSCALSSAGADLQGLKLKNDNTTTEYKHNDLARGCALMGYRMFFYSALHNAIMISEASTNKDKGFSFLYPNPDSATDPFKVVPSEEIQSLTDFNGNIITFTPSGMERWLLSGDANTIIQRDPTFHHDHRIRYSGSYVRANRELYFYTDDFHVFRLSPDMSVETVFNGQLPFYKPFEEYLDKNQDLPMSYFKMLGYHFITIGGWMFNLDSNTWSTYNYDGWKKPTANYDPNIEEYVWENDSSKQCINVAAEEIVCTYANICKPLSYKEMQDTVAFDDTEPSLIHNKHQWGEIAFFTTRQFQEERNFSLDGVEVYVRGGLLQNGAKMWLKVLTGGDQGDFDENDESTYGVEATYRAAEKSVNAPVGHFIWRLNLKTDRFQLQFITKEKRGIVVQSVLANITTLSESQGFREKKRQAQQNN